FEQESLVCDLRRKLHGLTHAAKGTDTQYVRCIKPNSGNSEHEFIPRKVVEQLRGAGITEMARVMQTAYPASMEATEFAHRYA
ncbi:unnamed protein product, partial [Hapterophycus canaliculatus]